MYCVFYVVDVRKVIVVCYQNDFNHDDVIVYYKILIHFVSHGRRWGLTLILNVFVCVKYTLASWTGINVLLKLMQDSVLVSINQWMHVYLWLLTLQNAINFGAMHGNAIRQKRIWVRMELLQFATISCMKKEWGRKKKVRP